MGAAAIDRGPGLGRGGAYTLLRHLAYLSHSRFNLVLPHHGRMNGFAPPPTETALVLRPFQNIDAPVVARLVTEGVRGHWTYTAEQFRERAESRRLRLVAERGGEVVATLHLGPFGPATPDALRLDLAGDGTVFSALYLAALSQLPGGFTRLLGVTREDWPEKMDFFHAAGFRNAWQSWGAHLELGGVDFGRFRPLEKRLCLQGYEVERLSPDAPEADCDALHALYGVGVRDAPRNPTTTPDPLTMPNCGRWSGERRPHLSSATAARSSPGPR